MTFAIRFAQKLSTVSVVALSLLCLSAGCGGGATEADKKAAEKAPDLELGEAEPDTSEPESGDKTAPEKKENVEGEEKK